MLLTSEGKQTSHTKCSVVVQNVEYLEVITRLFSYWPVYHAWALI